MRCILPLVRYPSSPSYPPRSPSRQKVETNPPISGDVPEGLPSEQGKYSQITSHIVWGSIDTTMNDRQQ